MARVIPHTHVVPFELKPQGHSVWLCQCGLSQNLPYCDGSHTIAQREKPETLCVYNPLTQQKSQELAVSPEAFLSCGLRKPRARVLATDGGLNLLWLTDDSDLFTEVLRIRQSTGLPEQAVTDASDKSADIYLLAKDGRNIATMRVNQVRRGAVDCSEFYPRALLEDFSHCLGSASRLVRDQSVKACPGDIRFFLREVWRHQFRDGMRIDVTNCHEDMEPFYVRLGYRQAADFKFTHPRLSTPSLVMIMVADPSAETPIKGAFQDQSIDRAELQRIYGSMPSTQNPSRTLIPVASHD